MQEWHLTTWRKKNKHHSSRHVFGREEYSSSALPQYGQLFKPTLRMTTFPLLFVVLLFSAQRLQQIRCFLFTPIGVTCHELFRLL
jgi:hypothetical protein